MTNAVKAVATALEMIESEPEAALSSQISHSVEPVSSWLAGFSSIVDRIDGYVWGGTLVISLLVVGLVLRSSVACRRTILGVTRSEWIDVSTLRP